MKWRDIQKRLNEISDQIDRSATAYGLAILFFLIVVLLSSNWAYVKFFHPELLCRSIAECLGTNHRQ